MSEWFSPWEWSSSDWAGLTFLVLVAAALVAWRQVKEAQRLREEQQRQAQRLREEQQRHAQRLSEEQQRLREEQARPFVTIDFEPWNPFVDLKITNVGKTAAYDVQFEFSPKLVTAKDQQRPNLVPIAETNLFANGIASFPPGKQVILWFDRYPDRIEQGLPDRYDVRISYNDPSGKEYSEQTVLDLGMYRDIGEITRYGIHDVHERLKEISKTLSGWTHPEGLKVLTPEDRKRYAAEIRARRDERLEHTEEHPADVEGQDPSSLSS